MLSNELRKMLKETNLTKEDLKVILLDNFVKKDTFGDLYLNLNGLDFSDFEGNVDISNMKVKKELFQSSQKVEGNLFQRLQEVQGDLWQDSQKIKKNLNQFQQEVEGNLYQDSQKVKGNLCQNDQTVEGNLYSCESIIRSKNNNE